MHDKQSDVGPRPNPAVLEQLAAMVERWTPTQRPMTAPGWCGLQAGGFTIKNTRPLARTRAPWQERFWRFVPANCQPDACWNWTGTVNENGYGTLGRGGRDLGKVRAHRASYEIHHGPIPAGIHICHRCDNRRCVNPAHLFAGTRADNMADMAAKGRVNRRGKPKLTDDEVIALRESYAAGDRVQDIADRFGISTGQVSRLARGTCRPEAGGPITSRRGELIA